MHCKSNSRIGSPAGSRGALTACAESAGTANAGMRVDLGRGLRASALRIGTAPKGTKLTDEASYLGELPGKLGENPRLDQ